MTGILLLGILGGFVAAKWYAHRRACGSISGHRRFRRHFGMFHPGQLLWASRVLRLDGTQREQVKDILRAMQRLGSEFRLDQAERMESLGNALRADRFDRTAVEAKIATQIEKEAAARKEVLDRIELFHAGLTTEQRALLQQMLADEETAAPAGTTPPA